MRIWHILIFWPIIGLTSCILCFLFLKIKDNVIGNILFSLWSLLLGPFCLWFFIDMYKEENHPANIILKLDEYNEFYQLEIINPINNKLGKHNVTIF